jgi:hypothetical protein
MKKQPFVIAHIARATLISVAFCALGPIALAAMTEPFISYTVKKSDTLQGLSRTLLSEPSKWGQVARLNGLKNANLIYPGQMINVPRSLLNLNSQPRVEVPGTVISVQGDVTISGQKVQAGAPVPEGARLQTGPNSSAVVQLGDGSRLQLMPKTLADVVTQHGYALRDPASSASTTWFSGAIRLVEGVLDTLAEKRANRLTPLEVTTPTSVVGVRGTHFRVAYEDPASGAARTEVLEGKVRTDNSVQKVGADVGGGFGAAVKPQEREIKVVALLPALQDAQLPAEVTRSSATVPSTPSRAEWTVGTLAGAVGYRAQFAADDKFAQIQSDIKSASPAIDLTALANGKYYARVRGIDPSGIEGFDAIKLVEIKTALVWPNEIAIGATAQYVPDGVLLKVYGNSVDTPKQLTAQVARDAAFTQGLQTVAVGPDATVVLPNVPIGQRSYVRFTATGAQGAVASSPVFTMDIPGNWGSTVLGLAQALQPLR